MSGDRHFREAAALILKRRNWQTSPADRIEIVTLAHSFRIDVVGEENGIPDRNATFSERSSQSAIDPAGAIHHALGWPTIIPGPVTLGARP